MARIAPSNGYDFPLKRDYRRRVWATFRDELREIGIPVSSASAALMPSLEGDEIEVALQAGFREWNLHVIDMEPAVVATLKRRYGRINTYGVTASRAFERMSADGVKLDCANLDFCGKLSKPFVGEITRVAFFGSYKKGRDDGQNLYPMLSWGQWDDYGGVFTDMAFVAVTMLRGRESHLEAIEDMAVNRSREWFEHQIGIDWSNCSKETRRSYRLLLSQKPNDRYRLLNVGERLTLAHADSSNEYKNAFDQRPETRIVRVGTYLSESKQTMLWSIWCLESYRSLLKKIIDCYNRGLMTQGLFMKIRRDMRRDLCLRIQCAAKAS